MEKKKTIDNSPSFAAISGEGKYPAWVLSARAAVRKAGWFPPERIRVWQITRTRNKALYLHRGNSFLSLDVVCSVFRIKFEVLQIIENFWRKIG